MPACSLSHNLIGACGSGWSPLEAVITVLHNWGRSNDLVDSSRCSCTLCVLKPLTTKRVAEACGCTAASERWLSESMGCGVRALAHASWEEGILWHSRSFRCPACFTIDQLSIKIKKPIFNKLIYQQNPDKRITGLEFWVHIWLQTIPISFHGFSFLTSYHTGSTKNMFLLVHLIICLALENTTMNWKSPWPHGVHAVGGSKTGIEPHTHVGIAEPSEGLWEKRAE